jgi:hypothetical protein
LLWFHISGCEVLLHRLCYFEGSLEVRVMIFFSFPCLGMRRNRADFSLSASSSEAFFVSSKRALVELLEEWLENCSRGLPCLL